MKPLLPALLFFLIVLQATAQDLIVTTKGDSINCKITKEKDDFVYFTYHREGSIENTLLPRNEIIAYARDYFTHSEIPKDSHKVKVYRPWRFALQGGYSYQTGKLDPSIPADFKEYSNKLRSGFHIGGDVAHYFNDVLGAGLKVSLLKQANEMDNIYVEIDGNRRYGRMSDDISMVFIAPTFTNRYLSANRRNAFILNVALGYLNYVNNAVLVDPITMKGGTIGAALDIGYDIGINENFLLGFQLSYTGGALAQYKLNDQKVELDDDSRLGLNRLDVSVGLRFGK